MYTTYVALGAVCKMTPMEKMLLYFSHCISEDKLIHMSKNKVPDIPYDLKKMGIPCSVCSHAKIKRKRAAPAATGKGMACCEGMATTVSAVHHSICRHLHFSMHVAKKPKSELKFTTFDKESNTSLLWRREEFLRIYSKENLSRT